MNVLNIIKGYTKTSLSELPLSDAHGNAKERWLVFNKVISPLLAQFKNPKILDLAMGSGEDSTYLLKQGYWVVGNEIDEGFISSAQELARREKLNLSIRRDAWTDIVNSQQYKSEEFDFIFCLGNSFPAFLLNEEERKKALLGFWRVLKSGGILLIDSINYDYMLNNAEEILKDPENNFLQSYKTTYIDKRVRTFPIFITPEKIRMISKHLKNKNYSEAEHYPATQRKTREFIMKTLGDVKLRVYYDWEEERREQYDFIQYVLKKV